MIYYDSSDWELSSFHFDYLQYNEKSYVALASTQVALIISIYVASMRMNKGCEFERVSNQTCNDFLGRKCIQSCQETMSQVGGYVLEANLIVCCIIQNPNTIVVAAVKYVYCWWQRQ